MMEQLIDKMEELEQLVISTICNSQTICGDCDDCDLSRDINNIKEEFEELKQLIELSDM